MLDTIALSLDKHQFDVRGPDRFSPSARGLLFPPYYALGGRGNFACVQNPTKADLEAGRYMPRLTLSKRQKEGGFSTTLRIEFSAPKLIFGNNFDELRSQDFEPVLSALRLALERMQVRVTEDTLRAARVSAIHYGKNIAFTDYTTCSMVMRELAVADIGRRLDVSHTDYRNEGHAIRYHTNSYEVTFYDKIKDLQMARLSEKRAIERGYGSQRDLFEANGPFPKQLEVLRMEVRLGSRAKIIRVMRDLGTEVAPTFAALFDGSIARDVLLRFWADVRSRIWLEGAVQSSRPEDMLAALAAGTNGQVRPTKLLHQLGALTLIRSIGVRGFRALMGRYCSARSWQRYKRNLRALPLEGPQGFSALRQVETALEHFIPLRLAAFRTHASDPECCI
jgi:hypothetical protein